MRSLRAIRLLQSRTLRSHVVAVQRLPVCPSGRRRYCSSCDPPAPPKNLAKSTTNPPTPPADHRQLAIDQELFINSVYSPGSPIFLPNGARIFNKLISFLRAQYTEFGFDEVITPTIYKKSLWEKSGHWENYAEDMYSVTGRGATGKRIDHQPGEDEEYGLKPMNCPGHCLIFGSVPRSYRDLPIRYADFSPLHRNEISGALSGLTRVRRFHQDDGHIFCRPVQIKQEISRSLEFVRRVYSVLGLGPYRLTLSTRPKDHYIGTIEEWDNAEKALKSSLDDSQQVWTVNEGDGAFYGPKIDIILKDTDGKEHQTATIQLDFQLPKRFELKYQAPAPEHEQMGLTTEDPELLAERGEVAPVLIHRAILGSVERLMALLIEHYNGRWPFWLNPRQVTIITVSDEPSIVARAKEIQEILQPTRQGDWLRRPDADYGLDEPLNHLAVPTPDGQAWASPLASHDFRVDIDSTPRSVKKKISEAKRKRYGAILVVGKDNVKSGLVNVDLSAIPDPHGFLKKSPYVLSSIAAAEQAAKQANVGIITEKIPRADANTSLTLDALGQSQVDSVKDLQKLMMSTKHLKALLEETVKAYV
ncbi:threonyl-tRNA synthetase [Phlyctema vagabunda]|uniref:threonine--tRNA ligase n=1 Tax=Phlyctema vagabunda TaxID=108571 RepID=A0ABR4PNW6_9HELO